MKEGKPKKALETINELSSVESLNTDEQVQADLQKLGIDDLRTKFSSGAADENQYIDKMNAEAV